MTIVSATIIPAAAQHNMAMPGRRMSIAPEPAETLARLRFDRRLLRGRQRLSPALCRRYCRQIGKLLSLERQHLVSRLRDLQGTGC